MSPSEKITQRILARIGPIIQSEVDKELDYFRSSLGSVLGIVTAKYPKASTGPKKRARRDADTALTYKPWAKNARRVPKFVWDLVGSTTEPKKVDLQAMVGKEFVFTEGETTKAMVDAEIAKLKKPGRPVEAA